MGIGGRGLCGWRMSSGVAGFGLVWTSSHSSIVLFITHNSTATSSRPLSRFTQPSLHPSYSPPSSLSYTFSHTANDYTYDTSNTPFHNTHIT